MRQLTPGDVAGKLARIEQSGRSRRWKRKARASLIKDIGATVVPGTSNLDIPTGRVCAKRRYTTFSRAFEALIDTWRMTSTTRHEKRVHPCKYCNGWHLTSRDLHEDMTHGSIEERPKSGRENRKSERHGNRYDFGTESLIRGIQGTRG